MLKQILNYQKIMFYYTNSLQGFTKDWRKGIPDFLGLLPLMLVPLVFSFWWNVPSGFFLSALFATIPLSYIYDGRLGRNSFFEYLPVSKEFKVLNMFLLLFFIELCYGLIMLCGSGLPWVILEIHFSFLLSSYHFDYAMMAQFIQETLFLFSTTLIVGSLMMMTCFFKHLITRIGVRIMLTFAVFFNWCFLLQGFPGGFLMLDIGWKNNLYALCLSVFTFSICLFLTMVFVRRDKKYATLSVRE